jgi:hypothetical protein
VLTGRIHILKSGRKGEREPTGTKAKVQGERGTGGVLASPWRKGESAINHGDSEQGVENCRKKQWQRMWDGPRRWPEREGEGELAIGTDGTKDEKVNTDSAVAAAWKLAG